MDWKISGCCFDEFDLELHFFTQRIFLGLGIIGGLNLPLCIGCLAVVTNMARKA
jgi:hypothetical protein